MKLFEQFPFYYAQVLSVYDIPNTMLNSLRSAVHCERNDIPIIIILVNAESIREEAMELVKGRNVRLVFTDSKPTW